MRRSVAVTGVRAFCLCVACGLGFLPGSVPADPPGARFAVAARVVPHVMLESSPLPVTVTADDVARGHLDVRHRYTLRTNAPDQVVLRLHPRLGLVRAIDVQGFGEPLRILDSPVEVLPPGAGSRELLLRLWFDPGTPPGLYPLPLHVTAAAI